MPHLIRLICCLFIVFIVSCKKKETVQTEEPKNLVPVLPETPYNYANDSFPSFFNSPLLNFINSTSQNPVSNNGAALGRVLFYDKQLSANNTISCASCHLQKNAFSDPARFSKGFAGGLTNRNSMAIINTRFSNRFFWDLRAHMPEKQVLMPIQNPIEMGMTLSDLVTKLQHTNYYPPLFEKAFGSTEVSSERISLALAQFIGSLKSYRSKYDKGKTNGFSNFSQLEQDGMNLFMSGSINCNHCHISVNFYTTQALNNGLEAIYTDNGYYLTSGKLEDLGKFKVPTLRNIELTAPYMHDGRFATLEEVVEHYNSGLKQNPNLDDRLTAQGITGTAPKQYNLSAYQKASLVAFLKTLTDEEFIHDPKFADPFVWK